MQIEMNVSTSASDEDSHEVPPGSSVTVEGSPKNRMNAMAYMNTAILSTIMATMGIPSPSESPLFMEPTRSNSFVLSKLPSRYMNSRIMGIRITSTIIEEIENAGPSDTPIIIKVIMIAKMPNIMTIR